MAKYSQFSALTSESGALRGVLAHLGAVCPYSNNAYTEAALFGLGGGISTLYWAMEWCGGHYLGLGTRRNTKEAEQPAFLLTICDRIGVPLRMITASSAQAGRKKLLDALRQGHTPIVWAHRGDLPYFAEPTYSNAYHTCVAFDVDETKGVAHVADLSNRPLTITLDELDHARRTTWSPKFRFALIEKPKKEPNLKKAITTAINECCDENTSEKRIQNVGLSALLKWADLLINPKDKKGWITFFAPGEQLFHGLTTTYTQIETRGFGGSASRGIYADFLEEAAPVIGKPALKKVAAEFRTSTKAWGKLAKDVLPSSIPLLKEARELHANRMKLFRTKGGAAIDKMRAIQNRLAQMPAEANKHLLLDRAQTDTLFGQMREDLLAIHAIEKAAFNNLSAAMK